MQAILDRISSHRLLFHASVHIQPYFISLVFDSSKENTKTKLEKGKQGKFQIKDLKLTYRNNSLSNFVTNYHDKIYGIKKVVPIFREDRWELITKLPFMPTCQSEMKGKVC